MPEPTVDLVAALRRAARGVEKGLGDCFFGLVQPCKNPCELCEHATDDAAALRDLAEKVEKWRAVPAHVDDIEPSLFAMLDLLRGRDRLEVRP